MSEPVDIMAAELLAAVEAGRPLVDSETDDPQLDAEFRRAFRLAEALARGLVNQGRAEAGKGKS